MRYGRDPWMPPAKPLPRGMTLAIALGFLAFAVALFILELAGVIK